jgi:hypothetical protein
MVLRFSSAIHNLKLLVIYSLKPLVIALLLAILMTLKMMKKTLNSLTFHKISRSPSCRRFYRRCLPLSRIFLQIS